MLNLKTLKHASAHIGVTCMYTYSVTGRHFARKGDIAMRQSKLLSSDLKLKYG